jgi:hypothetical protein
VTNATPNSTRHSTQNAAFARHIGAASLLADNALGRQWKNHLELVRGGIDCPIAGTHMPTARMRGSEPALLRQVVTTDRNSAEPQAPLPTSNKQISLTRFHDVTVI